MGAAVMGKLILTEICGALNKALGQGATFASFRREAQDIWLRRGMATPDDRRLRTVFQTYAQTLYQATRYYQMSMTVKGRPYWQYQAVMDDRTQSNHAALNGMIWEATHPIWKRIYPPNGFSCRCAVVSLSKDEMEEDGLRVQQKDPAVLPDPGWDFNPALVYWNGKDIGLLLNETVAGSQRPFERLLRELVSGAGV